MESTSFPEFRSIHHSSILRKTHSQPQSEKAAMDTPPGDPGFRLSDPQKYTHCKSMSSPLPRVMAGNPSYKGKKNAIALMLSTTLQPVMAAEVTAIHNTTSAGTTKASPKNAACSSSPNPKRNFLEGVKNTLRPKKSLDSNITSSSSSSSCSHSIVRQLPAQKDGSIVQAEVETQAKNKNADTYAMIMVASSDCISNSRQNSLVEKTALLPDSGTPQDKTS